MDRLKDSMILKIGEIVAYLFIFSNFIKQKVNMKLGYLVLILALIYVIKNKRVISQIPKKIYGSFILFFILGIIWNLISSHGYGISDFIHENGNFIYAIALSILLSKDFFMKKLKKINIVLIVGTNTVSYLYFFNKYRLFGGDLGIIRGIILLGLVYVLIYVLEKIFKNLKNIWMTSFLILPFLALVKSGSRTGALVIGIDVLFYLLYKLFMDRKNIKLVVGILIIFICLFSGTSSAYKAKIKSSFNTTTNYSNLDRIVMWKAGFEIIKSKPIFGIGNNPNSVYPWIQDYVNKNVKDEKLKKQFTPKERFARLHNMYVDIFVTNGILGIFCLYILFVLIPKEFIKSIKREEKVASFFAIITFYIYGLTWSLWNDFGIISMLLQIFIFILCQKPDETEITFEYGGNDE